MKPFEILLIVLLSVGAIQGIVYGFILSQRAKINTTANRFLAAILFFFSYRLMVEVLSLLGLGNYDIWYHILLEYNWIYGALIYFFVKSYISPDYQFRFRSEWIHFIPVTIEFIWSNFIKTQNFYWDGTRESLSWLGYWGYVIWMHYPTMYAISIGLILYYTSKAKASVKSHTEIGYLYINRITWITNLLHILRIFSVLVILVIGVDFFFFDYAFNSIYNYPLYIGLAIITYGMGIIGFQKRQVNVVKENHRISSSELKSLQEISEKINEFVAGQKMFLQPNLSLELISKKLEINKNLISKAINLIFEKNFSDYVNSLRIQELKSLMKDPKSEKFTLLSLALEVGFNSKASFNRAVKKLTGKSPRHLNN